MKPKSTASAKRTCLISITLALLGIQGCHWDDSMYQQYVKDDTVTSCEYDLLSLNDGRYIKKLDEDKWVCGDYNHVVFAETTTPSEVCVNKTATSADTCCTEDDIRLAAKTMKDKLCPTSAHNCVHRVLKNGAPSGKKDMCSEYKDSSINCNKNMVNLLSDPNNCGACGNICPGAENAICSEGKCSTKTCEETLCSIGKEETVCVNLSTDNKYCGSCENVCTETQRCDRTQNPENPKCIENDCKDACSKNDILDLGMDEDEFKNTFGDIQDICIDPSNPIMCGINTCSEFKEAIQNKKLGCTGELICQSSDIDNKFHCSCPKGAFVHGEQCLRPTDNRSCGADDVSKGDVCTLDTGYCDPDKLTCSLCVGGRIACTDRNDNVKCIDPDNSADFCGANATCENYVICNGEDSNGNKSQCVNGVCICAEGYAACGTENKGEKCKKLTDNDMKTEHCGAKSGGQCNSEDQTSEDYQGKTCENNSICVEIDPSTTDCRCESGLYGNYLSCDGKCIHLDAEDNLEYCGAEDCHENRGTNCNNDINKNSYEVICDQGKCACVNSKLVRNHPDYPGEEICIDTKNDPKCCGANEGSCKNNCIEEGEKINQNLVCSSGVCTSAKCTGNQIYCNGKCMENMESCDACKDGYCPIYNEKVETEIIECIQANTTEHCGSCGTVCPNTQICKTTVNNVVLCDCAENHDLLTFKDQKYCWNKADNEKLETLHLNCTNNECTCHEGFADLDEDLFNGCEINLTTDDNHCGKLWNACSNMQNTVNPRCELGRCTYDRCESRFAHCDENEFGCEADLTKPETCGSCNHKCEDNKVCNQDNYECCYPDNTIYAHRLDICCNPNARVWRRCLGPACWVNRDYWQCSVDKPKSGYWE